jgi:uncharacterized protein (DUF934 family)
MPIVTDSGFAPDDAPATIAVDDLATMAGEGVAVEISLDTDPETVAPHFNHIDLIVVPFPSFADGRGFSMARRLRALGYRGRLRASGHVITDQYAFARFCGFDEVQIGEELAARQTEELWLAAQDRPVPPFLKRKAMGWIA